MGERVACKDQDVIETPPQGRIEQTLMVCRGNGQRFGVEAVEQESLTGDEVEGVGAVLDELHRGHARHRRRDAEAVVPGVDGRSAHLQRTQRVPKSLVDDRVRFELLLLLKVNDSAPRIGTMPAVRPRTARPTLRRKQGQPGLHKTPA